MFKVNSYFYRVASDAGLDHHDGEESDLTKPEEVESQDESDWGSASDGESVSSLEQELGAEDGEDSKFELDDVGLWMSQ